MIRYALNCSHDHGFEGWFKSGAAFEQQVADGQLACPACGDRAIRKAVMAPAVRRSAGMRRSAADSRRDSWVPRCVDLGDAWMNGKVSF